MFAFQTFIQTFHLVSLSMFKYFLLLFIIFKYRFIYHLRLRCLIFEDFWNVNGKNLKSSSSRLQNFKILRLFSYVISCMIQTGIKQCCNIRCKFIKSDIYIQTDLDFIDRFYLRCRLVS